jgi:hypothetical protein
MDVRNWSNELTEMDVQDCKREKTELEAAQKLCENKKIAIELNVAGLKIGLCNNAAIMELLRKEYEERQKALDGEDNEWQ